MEAIPPCPHYFNHSEAAVIPQNKSVSPFCFRSVLAAKHIDLFRICWCCRMATTKTHMRNCCSQIYLKSDIFSFVVQCRA
uniref:Uncharacterized protein n=1 Tax=Arundo donax TaxID=35708 RepID=A0A0A9CAP5_ARUDO